MKMAVHCHFLLNAHYRAKTVSTSYAGRFFWDGRLSFVKNLSFSPQALLYPLRYGILISYRWKGAAAMQMLPAKTIVTNTKSAAGWFGARYNMNIYRGCCHV